MTILYKYYSSALELDKYLIEPTIRLTQTSGLNDPFEGKISTEVMDILCKRITLINDFPSFDTEDDALLQLKEILQNSMNSLSVVSLTETQRNLLMWSHYASEHRGFCIGYESDIFEGLEINNHETCYCYHPVKVNYDSIVFDDEQVMSLDVEQGLTDDELNDTIKRAITTKSDAWIYEKEHRLVVPVEWCDKIIIKSISSLPKYVDEPFNKMKNTSYDITVSGNDAFITPPPYKQREAIQKAMDENYENLLARYKETIFLKNISKKKIKSVHFGINYPQAKQRAIINLIKDKKNNLSHVSLYRNILSRDRFELIQEKIII